MTLFTFCLALTLACQSPASATPPAQANPTVIMETGRFHRVVRPETETRTDFPIQVIQAGINPARRTEGFPAIAMESTQTTGILHKDSVVSMARAGVDTARSDFFICIGDQPELDFGGRRNADGQGFAAFGRVVRGMDVVRKIQASPVRPKTQTPEPPVAIIGAARK
jgi:peptidyl-prolyl cis-trans isomerase A (cyclophilin A)